MALVLSLRTNEDFFVQAAQFIIQNITSVSFELKRVQDNKVFEIDNRKMVEIYPEVMVSHGHYTQEGVARVVLEAPRRIIIMRGERLRQ